MPNARLQYCYLFVVFPFEVYEQERIILKPIELKIKMNFKCRICLFKIESDSCIDIFIETKGGQTISEILKHFAAVEITQGDGLPSVLCLNCEQKVRMLIDFRIQIINSDTELRKPSCTDLELVKEEWGSTDSINYVEEIKIENPLIEYKDWLMDDSVVPEGMNTYLCKVCQKGFSSEQLLSEHVETHGEEKFFKCYDCDKLFNKQTSLINHCKEVHNETSYKCEVCDKMFEQYSLFKDHWKTHTAAMSESEMECTPPELRECAQNLTSNLLPEKSKLRYERTYREFRDWCTTKGVQKYTSESVLLVYFGEVAKTKKPSSMWSCYSILKSTLNFKDNVDISKYVKLIAYLKKNNVGYQPKKSSIFTRENIENFLKNAPFEFLPHKAALVIGISGACRSDELFKMKTGDVDLQQNRAIIVLPNTKTYQPRSFVVTDLEWVEVLKCYINLRKNVEGDRFFLQIRQGKLTKQPYGHNSISQFPKKIASYLQLNNVNTYSGHCFRRTAATLLADSGGDIINLKKLGGWKSSTVAEGYVGSSLDGQLKIASMLSTKDPASAQNAPNVSAPGPSSLSCKDSAKVQNVPKISIPGPSSKHFHFSKENLHVHNVSTPGPSSLSR